MTLFNFLLLQDNYRIYDLLVRDPNRTPHGKTFYRNPDVPQRYLPSADLLRDHLRQCVLRYVKGAGESNEPQRGFDDLRAGGFNLTTGSRRSGSKGKRQREAELAGQLWGAAATARNQTEDVSPVAGPSARRRRKRTARDGALSYEQKKYLSETIQTLHGQRLELVIQIIREGVPEIGESQEAIELEIDTLPESCLTKLYDFVTRPS
jgi:hypothetical protein